MPTEHEQRAYHELMAWTLTLGDKDFIHQQVVDVWAALHATEESTPISIYFALAGLYLHLEKGYTGRQVQGAHMRLAQPHGRGPGQRQWPHFPLPQQHVSITIADVIAAPENERSRALSLWCHAAWETWRDSHAAVAECVRRDLGV